MPWSMAVLGAGHAGRSRESATHRASGCRERTPVVHSNRHHRVHSKDGHRLPGSHHLLHSTQGCACCVACGTWGWLTGLRERGNDTSRSTGRSGRQKAATQRNMRREERVTVQGPVKEQQPDGMSHRGGWGGVRANQRRHPRPINTAIHWPGHGRFPAGRHCVMCGRGLRGPGLK